MKKNKMAAILLSVSMFVSLIPIQATAAELEQVSEGTQDNIEMILPTEEPAIPEVATEQAETTEPTASGDVLPDGNATQTTGSAEDRPADKQTTNDADANLNKPVIEEDGDEKEETSETLTEQPGDAPAETNPEAKTEDDPEKTPESGTENDPEEGEIEEETEEKPEEETKEEETVDWTEIPPIETEMKTIVPDVDDTSAEELLTAYAQRELDTLSRRGRPMFKAARNLGDSLTGPNAVLYRENKSQIARIAAGELNSTRIAVDTAALLGKTSFSAEDLGMDIVVDGRINSDAIAYIQNQIDAGLVVQMLTQDCPYELYWFDKTRGFSFGFAGSYSVDGSGELCIPPSYVISYYVSGDCAPDHVEGGFTTDPTIGWQVQSAVSNIRGVVADAEGLDDLGKLNRYKQEICDRVTYNNSAAGGGYSYSYGNPWQLIWVFDNDSSTNVVCEGYSKAFQYLCDLSSFAAVTCYTVYGNMAVDGSGGGHMWNIVRMPDGKNYLADITNCDSGSIGSPDLLYLKGYASAAGSFAGGDMAYRFSCWGSTVEYVYAADMYALFSENDLTLSATDYGSAAPVNRIPGDCNSDGKVNGMDLVRLRRYLVGDNVKIDLSNADVTGDGKVTGMDLVRLRRYLVGDNVTLK